ncbi:MAG: pectate lyase, partial [Thermoanaerobaculia bacterium]
MPITSETDPSGLARQGARTAGGTAGAVLRVTTLAAAGQGSLKQAIQTDGPRLIVFEVGGVIDLAGSTLVVRNPHLTIAGQTAPDPGITLIRGGLVVETHDVVVQH